MQLKLRSIAIGILRFIASGATAAGIGLALAHLSKVAFSIAYIVPGGVIAMLFFAALLWVMQALGYSTDLIFGEGGADGPSIFAGVVVLGGFLFWWSAIFLAWTRYSRQTVHALPRIIAALAALIVAGGLLSLLKQMAPPLHDISSGRGGITFAIDFLTGLSFPLLWWGLLRVLIKLFPALQGRRSEVAPFQLKGEENPEQRLR